MDMLNQISKQIAVLSSGEKWTVSAQDLLISRSDFHSISVYLVRESQKGIFSIDQIQAKNSWFEQTTLTITKH
ncbi:hypothetical protein ACFODO_16945 [Acinetobacter sichuanensis]|uniref:Uncharacterized protein n=1 Tax=Acinetobacter sichuanensis TaxID=2136183 RepID=A0A371YPH3_9GAMM|nr:hypothetical protein [Acinetobacter sichuanensis]MDQ9023075.1 hypothetical protein [Acinetobacter sichuanensis]RFC83371.1 hypothetical protein C9E89_011790 [Acinetobacter sichuanensis]